MKMPQFIKNGVNFVRRHKRSAAAVGILVGLGTAIIVASIFTGGGAAVAAGGAFALGSASVAGGVTFGAVLAGAGALIGISSWNPKVNKWLFPHRDHKRTTNKKGVTKEEVMERLREEEEERRLQELESELDQGEGPEQNTTNAPELEKDDMVLDLGPENRSILTQSGFSFIDLDEPKQGKRESLVFSQKTQQPRENDPTSQPMQQEKAKTKVKKPRRVRRTRSKRKGLFKSSRSKGPSK